MKKIDITREEWEEKARLYGNCANMRMHNPALLSYGKRRGWNKNFAWPNRKSRNGYTKEQLKKECFDSSRRFHSRGEFRYGSPRNYRLALENDWLDEMYWLISQETPYRDRINYIYAYVFEQQKTAYIGETFHGSDRHNVHKKRGPVFEFAKRNNIEIPEPIILEDNLDRKREVRKQEHYWKLHYISLGYNTLNKGKTGEFSGSLGGSVRIWTRKKCYEKALLCSHSNEMFRRFPGAYSAAQKNKWMKDYTWFAVVGGKSKSVSQYTKDGQFVKRWDSIGLAALTLCHKEGTSHISLCCKGKRKSAYGFVWKYADEAIPA